MLLVSSPEKDQIGEHCGPPMLEALSFGVTFWFLVKKAIFTSISYSLFANLTHQVFACSYLSRLVLFLS